jgi:hypothetical protein
MFDLVNFLCKFSHILRQSVHLKTTKSIFQQKLITESLGVVEFHINLK